MCLSLAHAPPTDSLVKLLVGVQVQVEVEVEVVVVVVVERRRLENGFPAAVYKAKYNNLGGSVAVGLK